MKPCSPQRRNLPPALGEGGQDISRGNMFRHTTPAIFRQTGMWGVSDRCRPQRSSKKRWDCSDSGEAADLRGRLHARLNPEAVFCRLVLTLQRCGNTFSNYKCLFCISAQRNTKNHQKSHKLCRSASLPFWKYFSHHRWIWLIHQLQCAGIWALSPSLKLEPIYRLPEVEGALFWSESALQHHCTDMKKAWVSPHITEGVSDKLCWAEFCSKKYESKSDEKLG